MRGQEVDMTNVVSFQKRKETQPRTVAELINLLKKATEHRKCSHVFAVLVDESDGSVSKWAFSAKEIDDAAEFVGILEAIDQLKVDAVTSVQMK